MDSTAEGVSLGHMPEPGARWAFDDAVTGVFEDMLQRSIPQYEVMREIVSDTAAEYLKPCCAGVDFVDLGASRGDASVALLERVPNARGLLVEVSEPMLAACRERFAGARQQIQVRDFDLRTGYPEVTGVDATLSVLTLQFTPIEHRLRILRDVWRSLRSGGAFIFVEKVLGASADIDQQLVRLYYERKHRAGYSWEEIERKRLALEGVLVPVTARWNEDMLRGAGFSQVDCIWRCLNFAAWVAVK